MRGSSFARLIVVLASILCGLAPLLAQVPDRSFFAPVPIDSQYIVGVPVSLARDRVFATQRVAPWLGDPGFFRSPLPESLRTLVVTGRFVDLPRWDALFLSGDFDAGRAPASLFPYARLGFRASHVVYRPWVDPVTGRSIEDRYQGLAIGGVGLLVDLSVFSADSATIDALVPLDLADVLPLDTVVWASARSGPPLYAALVALGQRTFPGLGVGVRPLASFLDAAVSVLFWVSDSEPTTIRVRLQYGSPRDAQSAVTLLRFVLYPVSARFSAFPRFDVSQEGSTVLLSFLSVNQIRGWLDRVPSR